MENIDNSSPNDHPTARLNNAYEQIKALQGKQDISQPPPACDLPLSICAIYNAEDRDKHLDNFYKRLPRNVEVCFLETVPDNTIDEAKFVLVKQSIDANNNAINFGRWRYPAGLFSFSEARNICKEMATREWILFLDMDERLNYIPLEFKPFFDLDDKNIAAVGVYVYSHSTTKSNPHGIVFGNCQYRMFRNDDRIQYKGIVHENILQSVINNSLKATLSQITIRHEGYDTSDEVNIKKAWRNAVLGIRDIAVNGFEKYRIAKLYDSLEYLKRQHQLHTDETNNQFVQYIMKG